MGWTFYNSSGQQLRATADKAATQAEMEAASSTTAYVTPGRTHHHPGVAKAWAAVSSTGALEDSGTGESNGAYNIASVTDVGTGRHKLVWDVDFADANYVVAIGQTEDHNVGKNMWSHDRAVDYVENLIEDDSNTRLDHSTSTVAFGDQ